MYIYIYICKYIYVYVCIYAIYIQVHLKCANKCCNIGNIKFKLKRSFLFPRLISYSKHSNLQSARKNLNPLMKFLIVFKISLALVKLLPYMKVDS